VLYFSARYLLSFGHRVGKYFGKAAGVISGAYHSPLSAKSGTNPYRTVVLAAVKDFYYQAFHSLTRCSFPLHKKFYFGPNLIGGDIIFLHLSRQLQVIVA
jgi:hypothetical protein